MPSDRGGSGGGGEGIGVERAGEVFCRFSSRARVIKTRRDKNPLWPRADKKKKKIAELGRGGREHF